MQKEDDLASGLYGEIQSLDTEAMEDDDNTRRKSLQKKVNERSTVVTVKTEEEKQA